MEAGAEVAMGLQGLLSGGCAGGGVGGVGGAPAATTAASSMLCETLVKLCFNTQPLLSGDFTGELNVSGVVGGVCGVVVVESGSSITITAALVVVVVLLLLPFERMLLLLLLQLLSAALLSMSGISGLCCIAGIMGEGWQRLGSV